MTSEENEDIRSFFLEQIEVILKGIDKDETGTDEGWWETTTGAEFGARKLREIRDLLNP